MPKMLRNAAIDFRIVNMKMLYDTTKTKVDLVEPDTLKSTAHRPKDQWACNASPLTKVGLTCDRAVDIALPLWCWLHGRGCS